MCITSLPEFGNIIVEVDKVCVELDFEGAESIARVEDPRLV